MKKLVRWSTLILPLALWGCGAPALEAAPEEAELGREELPALSSSACSDSLFAAHPHTGTKTLSDGKSYASPLHVCDEDAALFYGLVDPVQAGALLAGTGYQPVLTKGKAVARIYVQRYLQGDLGQFQELVVAFDVAPAGAAAVVPYVNPYSLLLPSFNPQNTVLLHKLVVTTDASLRYGREVLGYDKARGSVATVRTSTGKLLLAAADRFQNPILLASVKEDNSGAAQLAFVTGLAAALGLSDPSQLPPFPEVNVFTTASRNVLGTAPSISHQVYYAKYGAAFFTPVGSEDYLVFSRRSSLGALLDQLGFTPVLLFRDRHLKFVVEQVEPL